MKSLKLFVFAFALLTVHYATASTNPIKPNDQLRGEMVQLIGSSYLDIDSMKDEFSADVLFTVNTNHEIIILSVDSDNDQLESYLQRKLNYKKVKHTPSKHGEIYLLPVKMVKDL